MATTGRVRTQQAQKSRCSFFDLRLDMVWAKGRFNNAKAFQAFKITDKVDKQEVRGNSQAAQGLTVGEYTAEASMTMLYGHYMALQSLLAEQNEFISEVEFDIVGTFQRIGQNEVQHDFSLRNVSIIERGIDLGGSDASTVEVPLAVYMPILLDGKRMVPDPI